MDCRPEALTVAARCFKCIAAGEMTAVRLYLLCRWLELVSQQT